MNYVLDAVSDYCGAGVPGRRAAARAAGRGAGPGRDRPGRVAHGRVGHVWGTDLAETLPLGSGVVTPFVVWLVLLLAPVVIIGWAGSVLLPRLATDAGLAAVRRRAARPGKRHGPGAPLSCGPGTTPGPTAPRTTGLLSDPVALFFLNWAGWWPLVILLGGVGAVLAGLISGAFRAPRKTPPLVRPGPCR